MKAGNSIPGKRKAKAKLAAREGEVEEDEEK